MCATSLLQLLTISHGKLCFKMLMLMDAFSLTSSNDGGILQQDDYLYIICDGFCWTEMPVTTRSVGAVAFYSYLYHYYYHYYYYKLFIADYFAVKNYVSERERYRFEWSRLGNVAACNTNTWIFRDFRYKLRCSSDAVPKWSFFYLWK